MNYRARIFSILALGCCLGAALAAEDEQLLLTIEGNLIGLIESGENTAGDRGEALRITDRYYGLLPPAVRSEVTALHAQIVRLIPDFEVAYAAADSAEITHVMSEIDLRLAALQAIYVEHYTQEVTVLLRQAYQLILPAFGDE